MDFSGYFATMGLVVLLYDSLLTFSDEIKYLWRIRLSVGSILVSMARYFGICIFLLSFVINMETLSPMRCNIVSFSMQSCKLLAALGVNGILLLRAHALHGGRRGWIFPMNLLFIILTGLDISAILYASCRSKSAPGSYVTGVIAAAVAPLYDFGYIITVVLHLRLCTRTVDRGAFSEVFREEATFSAVIQCIVLAVWSVESATTGKLAGINVSGVNVSLPDAISIISTSRSFLSLRQVGSEAPSDSATDETVLDSLRGDQVDYTSRTSVDSTWTCINNLVQAFSVSASQSEARHISVDLIRRTRAGFPGSIPIRTGRNRFEQESFPRGNFTVRRWTL